MIKYKKRKFCVGVAAISCALSIGKAQANIEIVKGENTGLSLFGTGQMLGLGEYVDDNVKKDARMYLFMQQARLGFTGHLDDYLFYTELALGGEEMTPGSANPGFTLLEMRFDIPVMDHTFVRVGQFKTPYGAEFLTTDNERAFAENSIANLGTNFGRDIGLALFSKSDFLNWGFGVFDGGGVNTPVLPIHALPEDFGSPLMIARVGVDNTGGDVFSHKQTNVFKVDGTQTALYLQGAYETDSKIGHSSAMNIKAGQANLVYQQNLLLNSAWNPYLTLTDKASLYGLGVNGLMRTMVGDSVVTGEFQAGMSGFSDTLGSLTMYTAMVRGAAAKKPWELNVRIASLVPDQMMGPTVAPGLIGGSPFYEVTPSVTYYLKDWSKLMLEFQGMINVPVAHEPGDGAYVLSEMPSQTTYSATVGNATQTRGDTITRNFVPEVKLMWQITL